MRWPLSAGHWRPLVRRLPSRAQVALTFDDGPTPETTPQLLAVLARHNAKATFFFSGVRVAAHGELVAETVAAGHAVYGHGWQHVDLSRDPVRAAADMARVETVLTRYRPTPDTYLVRLPYFCGWERERFHRALAGFHPDIQFAWWSHSTDDWLIADRCRDQADLEALCSARAESLRTAPDLPGGVILMHEAPFDIRSPLNPRVQPLLTRLILGVLAERGLTGVALRPATARRLSRWILSPSPAIAAA